MERGSSQGPYPAFTLIELLVVIAILAILAALLLPVLSSAKQKTWTARCLSNLQQIGLGMNMFADDGRGFYPESGGTIFWNQLDPTTHKHGWTRQIISYTQNTNVYHCPANASVPTKIQSFFNYFNGARAEYVIANKFGAVNAKQIDFPSFFVLAGDTVGGKIFDPDDCDKDDYTQNCVGGAAAPAITEVWQIHSKGQNVMFADGHSKWYKSYNAGEMTFAYTSMTNWIQ